MSVKLAVFCILLIRVTTTYGIIFVLFGKSINLMGNYFLIFRTTIFMLKMSTRENVFQTIIGLPVLLHLKRDWKHFVLTGNKCHTSTRGPTFPSVESQGISPKKSGSRKLLM